MSWRGSLLNQLRPLIIPGRQMRLLGVLLASTLVFALFYLGAKPMSGGLFHHPWDKLVHYLFFGGLTGVFWVIYGGAGRLADLLAIVSTALVGLADEWTQAFTPGRYSSVADWSFDMLGALTAVVVLSLLRQSIRAGRADRATGGQPVRTF